MSHGDITAVMVYLVFVYYYYYYLFFGEYLSEKNQIGITTGII